MPDVFSPCLNKDDDDDNNDTNLGLFFGTGEGGRGLGSSVW